MINQTSYPFALPHLPYSEDALEPFISSRTLSFHHGKHHNAYVVNLNNLVKGTELESLSLESIITKQRIQQNMHRYLIMQLRCGIIHSFGIR